MATLNEHVLIIGAGSAGKRHLRNMGELGCRISIMDPRSDRLDEAGEQGHPVIGRFSTLGEALSEGVDYDGAVVASPPKFHVDQTTDCLEAGIPTLLEKPVSPTLQEAEQLAAVAGRADVPLLIGYTYRWWPPILAFREMLSDIGPLRHARFVMSAHLADWHPWEPYQDFFMSSRELGGGALLDESHFLDLMIWFFGMPTAVSGRVEHLSPLQITSDDNVDLLCSYADGLRVRVHLDLYGRPHEKSISVTGDSGTVQCMFDPHVVRVGHKAEGWEETHYDCDRNTMFMDEARDFLTLIRTGGAPQCTIEDGMRVLRIVEAARESSRSGCAVEVER